jgi:hypothetical protein
MEGDEIGAAAWKKGTATDELRRIPLREPSEGKIGRAVLTIALVVATALLAATIVALIGFAVQRQLRGKPIQHREAPHPPALSFNPGQVKPP